MIFIPTVYCYCMFLSSGLIFEVSVLAVQKMKKV